MAKYLIEVRYQADGVKGLLKDGGTKRRQVAEQALKSVGATVEAFYFAMGDVDAYVLCDAPDHATVTAASMTINASGVARLTTIVLLTAEEMDRAAKTTVSYRAPGS